jgi:hypothetical protein
MGTVRHPERADRRLAVLVCAAAVLAGGTAAPAAAAPVTGPQPPVVAPVTAEQLGATWRPGCPVGPESLRRIDLDYFGLDTRTHRGSIVVNQDLVPETIAVFDRLYRLGFPIERMRTVENYPGADDELSMRDNNTSAFNCRGIPGSAAWSYHAYGRAIDLNPRFNPYIDRTGAFEPANAEVYLDRTRIDPGLLKDDDAAVRAFTDHGWSWGGYWRTPKDYQHFEWSG